jgi:hypothetical protein
VRIWNEKILYLGGNRKFFDADPGWKNVGAGMEKLLSGIWDDPG